VFSVALGHTVFRRWPSEQVSIPLDTLSYKGLDTPRIVTIPHCF